MNGKLWIHDELALQVIASLNLTYRNIQCSLEDIEEKESLRNQARRERLDDSHAASIAAAIEAGIAIPAIVVRRTKGKLVIAGGNHRFAACKKAGIGVLVAYEVECTDGEFGILCRQLNAVVGKGSDYATRLWHAVDAVEKKQFTVVESAATFYVSKSAITREIRAKKARARIESAVDTPAKLSKLSKSVMDALATVQANSVINKAIELRECCTVEDTVSAISKAKEMPESEAIAYLEESIERHKSTRSVKSQKRAAFLRALTSLEKAVYAKSLDAIDIPSSEKTEVKDRCAKLANTLISL